MRTIDIELKIRYATAYPDYSKVPISLCIFPGDGKDVDAKICCNLIRRTNDVVQICDDRVTKLEEGRGFQVDKRSLSASPAQIWAFRKG